MLHVLAQLSGATAYGAFLGCVIAAAFAIGSLDGEPAVRLARILALVGGSAVLVASSSSTLYYWLIGSASARSALLVEMGLLALAAVFAVVVARAIEGGQRASQ
jgi:hypothetical protein